MLENLVRIEKVMFTRPSGFASEVGIRIERCDGRSIIIDKDFNIVINCSYDSYMDVLAETCFKEE